MTISAFHASGDIVEVGPEWYQRLKSCAATSDGKRSRLCLHPSPDDALHEMIIVFHRDAVIRPHRHGNKSESFHIVFGEIDVLLMDEEGSATRIIPMGDYSSGKTHVYRLNAPIWHTLIIRSEFAAIHEVTNGPFRAEGSDFAPWAPEDPNHLKEFLAAAVASLQGR